MKIIGWVDNERFAINTLQYDDGIQIIFNAFTGEWQELLPSFPYASDDGVIADFDFREFDDEDAIYDPTLSVAIIKRYSRRLQLNLKTSMTWVRLLHIYRNWLMWIRLNWEFTW